MKRFPVTIVLIFTLGITAIGGEIPSVPGPPPPTDEVSVETEMQELTGDVPRVGRWMEDDSIDSTALLLLIGLMF